MDKADSRPISPQGRAWSVGNEGAKEVSDSAPSAQSTPETRGVDKTDNVVSPTPGNLPLDAGLKPPARIDDSDDLFRDGLPEVPSRPFSKIRRAPLLEESTDEAALAVALQAVVIPVLPPPVQGASPRSFRRVRAPKAADSVDGRQEDGAEAIIAGFRQKVSLLLRVIAFGAALVMAARVALRELRALRYERTAPTGRDGVDGRGRRFRLWLR